MMSQSLATLLAGVGAGLIVAVPIGPMGILCMQRTLAFGLAAGLATGLGAATVHLIFGSIAAFGLSTTLTARVSAGTQSFLSLVSASLLMWFAVRIACRTVVVGSPLVERQESWAEFYVTALALGLCNPMTAILFAACLPILTASDDPKGISTLVSGVFLGSAAWWVVLSTTVSMIRYHLPSAAIALTNKMSGLVLASFGMLMFASACGLKLT